MNLKNRKILITGGAGFIGSYTVDVLVREGADVVVVDNLSTGKRENLNPAAKFYEINIANSEFENILEKERPDIIYHFAFFVLVPQSIENPLLDMDALVGSARMLKKIKEMGGVEKIVFASSGFLYGNNPHLPVKETEPIDPISSYVIVKQAVENYLKFYQKTFNMPYVILRYAAIYGPRQITGAMADYIRKLAAGQQAEIWGDGTKTRDYTYIDDAVRANLMALDVPDSHPYPVFNIGTGKETTLNELYKKIAAILGKEAKPIYRPDRLGEQIRYCLDASKIRRELGWQFDVDLDEGLKKVLYARGYIK